MFNEFLINGISRSGHHAVIYWVFSQIYGSNVTGKEIPDEIAYFDHCCKIDGDFLIADYGRSGRVEQKFRKAKYNIYNVEELPVYEMEQFDKELSVLSDRPRKKIIMLRDPFNNYASRYKKAHRWGWGFIKRKWWKNHAKAYLDKNNDIMFILYNKWFCDEKYREEVINELGFEHKPGIGLSYVPFHGGGSSFERKRDGRKMDVLNRWRKYKDDQQYFKLFDPEMLELSSKIFSGFDEIENNIKEWWKSISK